MIPEYFKHLLIRTPLQEPSHKIKSLIRLKELINFPEQREIQLESDRINILMKQIIFSSANCLDIGAHLGSVLTKIVELAPKGKHLAFEAIPYKADWLKKKFPEVEVRQVALTDKQGETKFYLDKDRTGYSGMHPNQQKRTKAFQELVVPCNRLDDLLPENHKIDFIKIDVEGAELSVFKGARNTLSRYHPTILFECVRSSSHKYGVTPRSIFEFLTQEYGYSIFLIKDFLVGGKPLTLERFEAAMYYPFQAFNFVAK
jgi:FkbM family methyltransferase